MWVGILLWQYCINFCSTQNARKSTYPALDVLLAGSTDFWRLKLIKKN